MSWFRIDDQFAFHAKVIAAGNEAIGVWTRMGAWSCAHLTEGVVPLEVATLLAGGNEKVLERLVMAKLLEAGFGIYVMHDFLDWNPTAKEVKRQRKVVSEARRAAGSKGAQRRWQTDGKSMAPSPSPSPSPSPKDPSLDRLSGGEGGAATADRTAPPPDRLSGHEPDPWGLSPSNEPDPEAPQEQAPAPPKSRAKRASRKPAKVPTSRPPDGWDPLPWAIPYALQSNQVRFTPDRTEAEVEAFLDKAASKGWGFACWDAGFRTWLRNARKWDPNAPEPVDTRWPPPKPPPAPPPPAELAKWVAKVDPNANLDAMFDACGLGGEAFAGGSR